MNETTHNGAPLPENKTENKEMDTLTANTLRLLSADAVQKANSGHPGLPLGAADIVTVLWSHFLKHNPQNPTWPNRDRFILSAGHGSALLYSLLHVWGYPVSLEDLKQFRQWGSRTPGHPEYDPAMGIEMTTGPLGQGFATAVGVALAERHLAACFNRPNFEIIDHFTYVLASDGDLMEGISHEAASLAGHWGLGKLIVFYDDNRISIDGPTSLSCSDDAAGRFLAYGWQVLLADGHDKNALANAVEAAQSNLKAPTIIICRTHIGWGSPRQDMSKAHGEPLGLDDLRRTKEALNWPLELDFYVPDAVREYINGLKETLLEKQESWNKLLEGYFKEYPDKRQDWVNWQEGKLPADLNKTLPIFDPAKALATRTASGQVLEALYDSLPVLVGGSADLTPSNNTHPKPAVDMLPPDYNGRYIRFGIREHAMGTILNGLALHGLRPYGGTFMVFSDYMRPAIRLAALMKLPVIYIFTHDSIGLGEDGPTHQPIEHLTALRCIPNLVVLRPADANETRSAWLAALERKDGPTALILTRQALPLLTPESDEAKRGAYILVDAPKGHPAKVVLLATGSEVSLAVEAQQLLKEKGIAARVVSMPSWELFDAQSEAYRCEVIPPQSLCLSVEAGRTLAWNRYVSARGVCLGLDHFGASAPYQVLYTKFGLTAENIAAQAMKLIGK
ncbi:MAG: transketolase [Anaerolineae bacterium]|nr:transketolase [Anaerolineae bacterium]